MPAVIAAAYAALLDAAEFERGAAMRAVAMQEADAALAVAEDHQILAEDADRHRPAGELRGHRHRLPEAAVILAARRAGTDMGQLGILGDRQPRGVAVIGLGRPAGGPCHARSPA